MYLCTYVRMYGILRFRVSRMRALTPPGTVRPMPSVRLLKPLDGEIVRSTPTQARPVCPVGPTSRSVRPRQSRAHRRCAVSGCSCRCGSGTASSGTGRGGFARAGGTPTISPLRGRRVSRALAFMCARSCCECGCVYGCVCVCLCVLCVLCVCLCCVCLCYVCVFVVIVIGTT